MALHTHVTRTRTATAAVVLTAVGVVGFVVGTGLAGIADSGSFDRIPAERLEALEYEVRRLEASGIDAEQMTGLDVAVRPPVVRDRVATPTTSSEEAARQTTTRIVAEIAADDVATPPSANRGLTAAEFAALEDAIRPAPPHSITAAELAALEDGIGR